MTKPLVNLLLAVSFFFAFKHPLEVPGVTATTIVAGFERKAECEDYRAQTKEMLEAFGVKASFSNCEKQQDV